MFPRQSPHQVLSVGTAEMPAEDACQRSQPSSASTIENPSDLYKTYSNVDATSSSPEENGVVQDASSIMISEAQCLDAKKDEPLVEITKSKQGNSLARDKQKMPVDLQSPQRAPVPRKRKCENTSPPRRSIRRKTLATSQAATSRGKSPSLQAWAKGGVYTLEKLENPVRNGEGKVSFSAVWVPTRVTYQELCVGNTREVAELLIKQTFGTEQVEEAMEKPPRLNSVGNIVRCPIASLTDPQIEKRGVTFLAHWEATDINLADIHDASTKETAEAVILSEFGSEVLQQQRSLV